jgi:uncharacterized protein YgiM (DUF1202 family)
MTSPESGGGGASKLAKQIRWALVAIAIVFLAVVSGRGGQSDPTDDPNDIDPADGCSITVTADVLNVRTGPGTQHPTVDRLNRDAVVDALPETSNGFRKLADDRWVAAEYTNPSPGCN